jgi:glycerol-3-phosphate dehydrogenase (NAD(P)+)
MDTLPRVVVIGGGELGKAVGILLKKNNITVELWDADPSVVPDQKPIAELVSQARFVFFCVPSWAMRVAVTGVLPYLTPDAVVASFAKGMEKDLLQTMAEMVPTLLPPTQPFVVVGGPMLAAEIAAGKKAIGVFAASSRDVRALGELRNLFSSPDFAVETSDDTAGVALAGVLKNIYAVALGIADGLEFSGNEKGWIAARAIREMREIAATLGMNADVALGTAGAGDFIATGYSVHSRNRETGIEIVATGTCSIRGEGLNALPFLIQRLGKEKAAAFPLLMLINTIGIECQPARSAFEAFFLNAAALVP